MHLHAIDLPVHVSCEMLIINSMRQRLSTFKWICALCFCEFMKFASCQLSFALCHELLVAKIPQMASATRLFGLICTFAACDHIFPPPRTPPLVVPPESSQNSLIVDTNCGAVEGYYANSLNGKLFRAFEGVPYAEPPIGAFRFQEPRPKKRWTGLLRANRKVSCIQMDPLRYYNVVGSEDCLYLNVYTPENRVTSRDRLPVYIFIHGGSYFWGAGHSYGPTYIMDQDIILVTINYRLGSLGFLSTGDSASFGNWGLKDQALALDWVRDNIVHFGGDPSKITMGGQSAGGASVHLHMMSPRSQDKFRGAIIQSASALSHWAVPPNQEMLTRRLAKVLGCESGNNLHMVECLKRRSAKHVVSAQYRLFEWFETPPILFGPVVEPNHTLAFLTEKPATLYAVGKVANIPTIQGVTRDEGDLFALVNYLTPLGTRNLLTKINEAVPRVLMYDKRYKNVTKEVQAFYLGRFQRGISLSGFEALQSISSMVGDRYFYAPFHKTLRTHSEHVQAPLYAYLFTYDGQHSVTEKFFVSPRDWGVMHMDEMQYLFNSTEFYAPIALRDRGYIISEYMVKLWTSFIQTGAPVVSSSPERITTREWVPYGSEGGGRRRQLLEINFDSKMKDEMNEHRVEFWKGLGLY